MEQTDPTLIETFDTTGNLWILISAALVFFMQAGFKVLETGLVKNEHRSGIGVKNLMDWVAGSLAFFILGFGLMFGKSSGGIIGTDLFLGVDFSDGYTYVFFIFQLAFAGTALTIVSGAMSGRTALAPYFVASIFTAVIIYPIFGHWAWGNLLYTSNEPWLAKLGFMDFAGSTVVHSVGAWVGLVGIIAVGPRLGRYNATGKIQSIKASDYSYSVLGLMILWLGWWGFNGGSTLAFDSSVPKIILNTNIAAAAACLSAYIHVKFFQSGKDTIEKIIGGSLTGLVAITACCNVVSPASSIFIGLIAGLVHNYAYILISETWKLDDPVGAIAVHGFGGVFGTLAVALFGKQDMLVHDRWTQLGVQLIGIFSCIAFTMGASFLVFRLVKISIGLRLSPEEEFSGKVFESDESDWEKAEQIEEQIVSQVSVRIGQKSYNLFSVNEYLNLPRETRVGLVRTGSVQYLDEIGNEVPSLVAVRFLAGIIEQQRDKRPSLEELVELGLYSDSQKDMNKELQNQLMMKEQSISSVFPDSFVFLHPKKATPSDFFWHGKVKEYNMIIVASCVNAEDDDCTAISSTIISQLNEIVSINKVLAPEKILDQLDEKLRFAMNDSSRKSRNGVDIGILLVDSNKRKVYYSAAGTGVHLYVKKLEEELTVIKGIDVPIGWENRKTFNRKTIDYTRGDSYLIFTDGYGNQLNANGKRYQKTRLRNAFKKNASKSMEDQQFLITREFESWRAKEEQTEDILVIGLKP